MRIIFALLLLISCKSKTQQRVGGQFENSSSTYMQMPTQLNSADTSEGWKEPGQKLVITGTVFKADGKTPAKDVMIYYYHTNTSGKYLHDPGKNRSMAPNSKGQTHGYLRGWIKTEADGKYSICTARPGAYPTGDEPAHIHLTIKEPGMNEYYIDDIVFDDDILLTAAKRRKLENRGGSGIVRPQKKDSIEYGQRDIFLGLHIPDHPFKIVKPKSGNNVGEEVISFMPNHAWGPDRGTRTCPVCKYGKEYGILFFSRKDADWNSIEKWLSFLEQQSAEMGNRLKCYFTWENNNAAEAIFHLENIGRKLQLRYLALTYVPAFSDEGSEVNYNNINSSVSNTFIIYKNRRIIGNFSDFQPTEENFIQIKRLIK